jgi:ribosomal protein L37AE/L43A
LKLPKFYIGSTSIEKVRSNKYFGSIKSKRWKSIFEKELKDNITAFSIQILSLHENRTDALEKENLIQHELNVVNSMEYFNEAYASPRGFFGRGCVTEIQKQKASERIKLMNQKKIPGRKPGNNKSGKHQNNTGSKNPMFGKRHTELAKKQNSESVKNNRKNKFTCSACGKEVDIANLNRWHNSNCKITVEI